MAFTTPSLTFTRHRAGLRGLPPSHSTHRVGCPMRSPSSTWLLLQSSPPALGPESLLSWDSSACAPPPMCRSDVHSQMSSPTSFGQTMPTVRSRSARVVSHHLDGLLHPAVAGLLHPATGQRFIAFHLTLDQASSEDSTCALRVLPAMQLHTPRRIPPVDSRTASPRPLPSCRYHTLLALLRSSHDPDRSFGPPRWHRLQTSRFDRQPSGSSARARIEPKSSSRLLPDADPRHLDSGSATATAEAAPPEEPGDTSSTSAARAPSAVSRTALEPVEGATEHAHGEPPGHCPMSTRPCDRPSEESLPRNRDHRAPRPPERSLGCRATEVTPQRHRPRPPGWTPRRPSPARVDGTYEEP